MDHQRLPGGAELERRRGETDEAFSARLADARAAALDEQHQRSVAQAESPLAKFARVWDGVA